MNKVVKNGQEYVHLKSLTMESNQVTIEDHFLRKLTV